MTPRIRLAFHEKPAEEGEPPSDPSSEEPPSGEPPHTVSHDRFAEWDEPATIAAVEAALSTVGSVVRLEANEDFPRKLQQTRPDIVFNIAEGLNGPNREAHVPAMCEFFGVPYTGSDVLTLALALDKRRAKEVFVARGVATAPFTILRGASGRLPEDFGLPAVVKPVHEGSSMGIPERALCETEAQVHARAAEIADAYR